MTSELVDALGESQGQLSAASADNNPVLQALLNNKDQQEAQLALINEAYADALENGDLEGANEISALADQLIVSSEASAEAALDNYFEAKSDLDIAQGKVDAILQGSSDDASDDSDVQDDKSGQEEGGSEMSDEEASGKTTDENESGNENGNESGTSDSSDEEDSGSSASGLNDQDSIDMVALTKAIEELGQARDALEEAKALLSPEDLQLIEAFLDLASAVEVYAQEGNGEMAKASAEALQDMLAVLPQGFDVKTILEDVVDLLNKAKAQAALEGDMSGAQDLASAQLMMKEAALGEFADAQLSKDTSVTDVLTGTVIIKPDAYLSKGVTYIGIKSLFDQIGGQTVWNPETQVALGIANKSSLEITVGSQNAVIGEDEVPMKGPAQLKDGRAYLPFNTVSQYIQEYLDDRFDGLRVIILPHLIGE